LFQNSTFFIESVPVCLERMSESALKRMGCNEARQYFGVKVSGCVCVRAIMCKCVFRVRVCVINVCKKKRNLLLPENVDKELKKSSFFY